MTENPRRICIVAQNAFGSITGTAGHIGGVELQTALLARYLATRGHDVSIVTWDEGSREIDRADGVRIVRLGRESAGLPVVRFFYPRWTSLIAALNQANAEIYYQNGAEYVTGQVALYCRRKGKRFVFSAASDTDCDPALPALNSMRERVLYRYGLRAADDIIVQTRTQQESLGSGFSRPSTVLPMPCSLSPLPGRQYGSEDISLLWVGRVVPSKRLDIFLNIAAAFPKIGFHIAGGADGDSAHAESMLQRAASIPNVIHHGPLPRQDLMRLYASCSMLACTSEIEGFPNTFLEAWAHGIPVISTFDPDGLVNEFELGVRVEGESDFITCLADLTKDPARMTHYSGNCHRYYSTSHWANVAMPRFEELLCFGPSGSNTSP